MITTRKLTIRAPRRMSVENGDGTYYTVPWTPEGVRRYKKDAGGYFTGAAYHDFEGDKK